MVATTVLMILLPNGSPRYIYPLIVVPCLLLGRRADRGGRPERAGLARIHLAPRQPPAFDDRFIGSRWDAILCPRQHWILLWTCLEGLLAASYLVSSMANGARPPANVRPKAVA